MKKIACFVLALLITAGLAARLQAQTVSSYNFTSTTGNTYTALDGTATTVSGVASASRAFEDMFFNATESVDYNETSALAGIPIGFDFLFDGQTYDKFVIGGCGFIVLGNNSSENVSLGSNAFRFWTPIIGICSDEGVNKIGTTTIKYKLEGSTPNQVMTVEYTDIDYSGNMTSENAMCYQIKLYESDNHIEFIFGKDASFEGASCWLGIGIRGAGGAHFRDPGDSWAQSTLNTNGNATVNGSICPAGLLYSFALPAPCEAPDATIADLSLTPTSVSVTGTFTVEEGVADNYMVVASTLEITGKPEAGSYAVGADLLGGKVIAMEEIESGVTSYSFTHEALSSNTNYYYAVYLYNSKCTGAFEYGEGVTEAVSTSTAAPASLKVSSLSLSEIGLTAIANSLNEDILVVVTDVEALSGRLPIMAGDFGIPASDAIVGDSILKVTAGIRGELDTTYGGTVIYTGPASGEILFDDNLLSGHIYHFAAFSKGANGHYSSVFAQADTVTPAAIPFAPDFESMEDGELPYGWSGRNDFRLNYQEETLYAEVSRTSGEELQEYIMTLPPIDFPEESDVLFSYYQMFNPQYGYDYFPNRDTLAVEVSTDGGESWDIVSVQTKDDNSEWTQEVPIRGYYGIPQALIRLRYVNDVTGTYKLEISRIRVDSLAFCDVPSKPYINEDNVIGGDVTAIWSAGLNEETVWNISYAQVLEDGTLDEWSEAVEAYSSSYRVSDLEGLSDYKVRVQAVCGVGSVSKWVESDAFTTGYVPSFYEDFDNLPLEDDYYYGEQMVLPLYWTHEYWSDYDGDPMPDTVVLGWQGGMYDVTSKFYDFKTTTEAVPGESDGSLAFQMNDVGYYYTSSWSGTFNDTLEFFKLPTIELLPEEQPYIFSFRAAYGTMEEGSFTTVESTDASYRLALYVSLDSGYSIVMSNPVKTWDAAALAAFGEEETITMDLSEYEGAIGLVLVVTGNADGTGSEHYLWIDNIGVSCACPVAKNLRRTALTATEASIRWNRDPEVSEWIVKLSGAGSQEIFTTTDNSYDFTELLPVTAYTVSVGHLCGSDTSAWTSISFTTGGVECDPITDVTVSDITRNSARLSWTGSAADYRIRIRPIMGDNPAWTYYTVTGAQTYQLTNLSIATEYEGGIQSVCGEASGDTSEYVDFEPFTTLELTCFEPYNMSVNEITYNSALFTWEGDAEQYQVEWSWADVGTSMERVVCTGKSYTMEGLDAYTLYEVRVRSICSAGDTSDWSDERRFRTLEMPACPAPTDLRVESITENSATLLWSLESEFEVSNYILRYRPADIQVWDSVQDIKEMSYELTSLEPKTAYLWSVLTACADGRYSGWGTQTRFETEAGSANEGLDESGLFLTASRHQIHVMNPSALPIERVRVYNLSGAMAEDYVIRSNENVILTTALSTQVAVVEVLTPDNKAYRFKVMLP